MICKCLLGAIEAPDREPVTEVALIVKVLQEKAFRVYDTNILIAERKHIVQALEFLGRHDIAPGAIGAMNEIVWIEIWNVNSKLISLGLVGEDHEDIIVIEELTVAS